MNFIGREICRDENKVFQYEWIVRNGCGGYAASSIACALTRRQHGLLVTPMPDSELMRVTLAKVDEEIEVEGQIYKLGTNEYIGGAINPDGYLYLQQVTLDETSVTFVYEAGRFQLTKTIWMEPARQTTYIQYALAEQSAPLRITLVPLCDYRANDTFTQGNEQWRFQIQTFENGMRVTAYDGATPYQLLTVPPANFTRLDLWYWRFQFRADNYSQTDLFVPGLFRAELEPGETFTLIATLENEDVTGFDSARALQCARLQAFEMTTDLSDQFTPDTFTANSPGAGRENGSAPNSGVPF